MKRFYLISAVIFLAFLIIINCGTSIQEAKPPLGFEKGLASLDIFDFTTADSVFSSFARHDSTSSWGLFGLGRSQQIQLSYWKSVEYFYKALELEPEFAPAIIGIGEACAQMGWHTQAIQMLEKGVSLSSNIQARKLLALEYLAAYEFDQAVNLANETTDESFASWVEAAVAQAELDLTAVKSSLKKASGRASSRSGNIAATKYYLRAGLIDSALYYNRQLDESSELKSDALLQYFKSSLDCGDYFTARQLISRVPENETTKGLIAKMKIEYYLAYSEPVAAFVANRDYQRYQVGNFDGMITNFVVKVNLADAFTGEQMLIKIDTDLETMKFPRGFVRLMRLYTINLHPDIRAGRQAVSRLEKQRVPDTDDLSFDQIEISIALATGAFDEYKLLVENYFSNYGESPNNMTRLADLLSRKSLYAEDRALELYPLILEKSGNFVPAFEGWLNLLIRNRKYNEALSAFESYPHFAERSPLLNAIMAVCLAETNKSDQAWKIFEKVMPEITPQPYLVDQFLRGLWKYDRSDIGQLVCDKYISLTKNNPVALALMAEWFCEYDQFDKALNLATKAESMPLATISAKIQKARAMYLGGKKQQATNLFVELLDNNEGNSELSLYYSQLLAMDQKNPRQAGNLARTAMSKSQRMLQTFLNLCYVYSQQKRNDLALGQAKQAIKLFPDHPRAFYTMGKIAHQEKKAEYKGALEQAIALGLAGTELEDAQKILGK